MSHPDWWLAICSNDIPKVRMLVTAQNVNTLEFRSMNPLEVAGFFKSEECLKYFLYELNARAGIELALKHSIIGVYSNACKIILESGFDPNEMTIERYLWWSAAPNTMKVLIDYGRIFSPTDIPFEYRLVVSRTARMRDVSILLACKNKLLCRDVMYTIGKHLWSMRWKE